MAVNKITIQGAREHNLKNISVEIPRDSLVVITGLSGSGKSTLAFDTIYAEGQRRYVESLSAYARQFLGQMEKPDVDFIEGLSPAIAIEQKSSHRNPRSTVGTITEVYDYLRLLFARIGKPYCPGCQRQVHSQSLDQIVASLMASPVDSRLQILAPLVRGRKGEHIDVFDKARKEGFARIRINGQIMALEEAKKSKLAKNKKHDIDIVIDRIVMKEGIRSRVADSLEIALNHGQGTALIMTSQGKVNDGQESWQETLYSVDLHCPYCDLSFAKLEPRSFSFNSPYGACQQCDGLGEILDFDPQLIVPDPSLSILQGAIKAWGGPPLAAWYMSSIEALAEKYRFDPKVPWRQLSPSVQTVILNGSDKKMSFRYQNERGSFEFERNYEGVIPNLRRRYKETKSDFMREEFHKFITSHNCQSCGGHRLQPFAAAVKLNHSTTMAEITRMSTQQAFNYFAELTLAETDRQIGQEVIKEILNRLDFLNNVGLNYLSLDRPAASLSGGEAQRIRLATQIGSRLMGVLYILDEPSIGLHQRDNDRLIWTLKGLRDIGNTVLVVEHDKDTIQASDYVLDLGPGAGVHGGYVVAAGTPSQVARNKKSLTGQYLSGKLEIPTPAQRRSGDGSQLRIVGANQNNLKNLDLSIPLKKMVLITGVSGSGKSTLINEILFKRASRILMRSFAREGSCQDIEGLDLLDKVINIDQSPIGRTPRSNPATYTGLFTPIRELFARLPESKIRGYQPGRFSFNVRGGRCESCQGDGIKKIEMHFLPDVYVTCEVCQGKRYTRESLEVRYKGKSIYDVLELTVEAGLAFFENIPNVRNKLQLLFDVGLGYVKLGQPATTLSGGEAQRVKLATELAKRSTGKTLYILDEPTTGLHFEDIRRLLSVLDRLVDQGNSMVIIEHNLDVIKCADWIIDLGPEGGDQGGSLVCQGSPEEVAKHKTSYTGHYLNQILGQKG